METINNQLLEVEKLIEDIYELRRTGLSTEGEYSTGNLIFKEFRNKGYLDNLKELRNKLIGKQLSLESLTEDAQQYFDLANNADLDSLKELLVEVIEYCKGRGTVYYGGTRVFTELTTGEQLLINRFNQLFGRPQGSKRFSTIDEAVNWLDSLPELTEKKCIIQLINSLAYTSYKFWEVFKDKFWAIVKNKENAPKMSHTFVEDTEKVKDGKWVNRGKEGTHGTFRTKKAADAQRKAMFAGGWKHESLEEDIYAFKNKQFDKLLDEGEFGEIKNNLVMRINSIRPGFIQKSSQKVNVGNNTYNKWKAVLHHNDANKLNNSLDNLTLILDSTENSPKYAELAHKLIHLYASAYESFDVKDSLLKVLIGLDKYVKYIIVQDNIVQESNFTDWWDTFGNSLISVYQELSIDEVVNQEDTALDERLSEKQRIDYRNELGRISFNQAIIQDNGLFHIYNIKENDVDRIVRQIRDLEYIEWVNKFDSGKYDFSKVVMFGQPQAKYYNITGKIKDAYLTEGKQIRQYVHYDKEGLPDASADTIEELAKILEIHPTTIKHEIMRGSDRYAKVVFDEDDEFDDINI